MNIIELISFIVFLVILVAVSYAAIAFGVKSRKQVAEIVQLKIDKTALLEHLEKAINQNESKSLEQTDGFVKFLSESRDWAFKYIEDVQNTIVEVKNNWGNGNQMEESIEKLFTFLPENKEK